MTKKTLSVIIPCRNQQDKIGETIEHIKKTASRLKNFDVEIIFVNDRSTDDSYKEAEKKLKDYKNKQLLNTDPTYVGNGKGLAVELGMTKAKGDYRLFMDADNSTKFEEIEKLIPYFDKYDIVLGTRYAKEAVIPSGNWFKSFWLSFVDVIQVLIYGHAKRYTAKMKQGRLREFVSRGGNLAFTVLLGQSFTDSRCGFKVYSNEASMKIFPQCRIKTWDFDSEALVLAKKYRFKMIEVPVVWYDDAGASNFKIKDMLNAFGAIFTIRWNQLLGRYKKADKPSKKLFSIVLVLGSLAMLTLSGYLVYNMIACGFASEINYYSTSNKGYYYGRRICRNLLSFERLKLEDVKNINKQSSVEIFAKKSDIELENELEKYFTGYNKFNVGEGRDEFTVYETICSVCGTK